MTTKPKAKKFRIRRSSPLSGFPRSEAPAAPVEDDGFGPERFPTAAPDDVMTPREVKSETDIDAIRREGLTGRQLRMARRVAQKNGLAPTSDFDAVRLLREAGIDPFQRANMLELVVSESNTENLPATTDDRLLLPETVMPPGLPSTEVKAEENRARDIMRIQRDIARRRKRRMTLLAFRLAFFVGLPTLLAGFYYYRIATPMYATTTEFVIQKAEGLAGGAAIGGLFAGTALATSQDSTSVQAYLESRDAMMRLDRDHGFKAAFSGPGIDPLQRMPASGSNEAAYDIYTRNVTIGYDPTEGTIKMEVAAPTPAQSEEFSKALIGYAEEQVDQMTQRMREDQMKGARESFDDAEQKLADAQRKVVDLQEKYKVLSSTIEDSLFTGQMSALQTELTKDQLSLQSILQNENPTQARVEPLKARIQTVQDQIAKLREQMTNNSNDGTSVAQVQSDLLLAQSNVQSRQLMMSQAMQSLETSRIEANRQVRYLSLGVNPVAPDEPTYPRAFENTLVALLIFGGIYLMLSMTASILREQVAA